MTETSAFTRRANLGFTLLMGVLFLGLVGATIASLVHVPYAVLSPGPVTNVIGKDAKGEPLITVSGHESYPTRGALDFTTVSVDGGPGHQLTALEYALAKVNPDVAIYPVEELFPKDATAEEVKQENTALMVDSKQEAIAVALGETGATVTTHVVIADFGEDSPAQKAGLEKNDTITAIGGVPIDGDEALRREMAKVEPGSSVSVEVRRGTTTKTAEVTTRGSQGRALLGIFLRLDFSFPYTVTIDAGDVGGPSAGLMFALGIYDTITPGPLTGGKSIAGTGSIDYTGAVGPIGGIRQKLIGAKDAGATFFLAPADNCDEVVGHEPAGLKVFKVASFQEAKAIVEGIAGSKTEGLPTCAGTPAAP